MAGNHWKDYLVKIIIPGSQGRDFIATGYPFRRGYILTARHAIDQPDCDASRQWRLVWEHQKNAEQKAIERKIDKPVIITSSEALDWAVIQCDFDEALHHAICFCAEPLVGGSYVESEGFPAIRHANPDGLSHLASQGAAYSKATDENYFQIDVNTGYPNPDKACGLSGAPVLNSAGHIIGLFAQVPRHLDGKTVWVLSMASILKDEEFNRLLTSEQKSPRYSAIKKLLESQDDSDNQFRDFLINAFQADGGSAATEKIVEAIDAQTMQQCLLSLYAQAKRMIEAKEEVDLLTLIAFCNHLLPEYASSDDEDRLKQYFEQKAGQSWHQHSATLYESLETSMARYDQRPVDLKRVDGSGDAPASLQGVNCMVFPDAAGGTFDTKTKLDETEYSFYMQYTGARARDVLFPKLSGNDQERAQARQDLRAFASQKLSHYSQKERQTRYYVDNPNSNNQLLELIAQQCPYFLLLKLNDSVDKMLEEEDCFNPLLSLYNLKAEQDS